MSKLNPNLPPDESASSADEWQNYILNAKEAARQSGQRPTKRWIKQCQSIKSRADKARREAAERERISFEAQSMVERKRLSEGREIAEIRYQHEHVIGFIEELRNAALTGKTSAAFAADRLVDAADQIISALDIVARPNDEAQISTAQAATIAGQKLQELEQEAYKRAEAARAKATDAKRHSRETYNNYFKQFCEDVLYAALDAQNSGDVVFRGRPLPKCGFALTSGGGSSGAPMLKSHKDQWVDFLMRLASDLYAGSKFASASPWRNRQKQAKIYFNTLWDRHYALRQENHRRYLARGMVE